MSKVVNFNKNGSAILAGFGKIRVATVDGVLMFRPTNRVNGRDLADLRNKGENARRVTLPAEMLGDVSYFQLEARKYGWYAVVACEKPVMAPGQAAPQGGSVSDR